MKSNEILRQRQYYKATASNYDRSHLHEKDEHYFALFILEAIVRFHDIHSVLDIGAGTGRVARFFKERSPDINVISVEPVDELRQIGYQNGLSKEELIEGDVNKLQFRPGEFDLVCEFGVLHHIKNPRTAVDEMLRVAKKGIFISDLEQLWTGLAHFPRNETDPECDEGLEYCGFREDRRKGLHTIRGRWPRIFIFCFQ